MNNRAIISQLREKAGSLYVQTFGRAYYSLLGHPVEKRFVIIGNARTGSNYLLDGLKSSPAIRMYHEIFAAHNRQIGTDFERILSTVYQYESRSTHVVGFKVFYNHLTDEEWKKLQSFRDLNVIHLTRRNRLRTVISLEIALKTGQWTMSGKSNRPSEKRLVLDPQKLLARLERVEAGEIATRARFRDRQILELVYEEMVKSPSETFAAVSAYLGVDGIDPGKIRLKRQNPEPLRQLIVNYDEIESMLRTSRFAEYLES